MYISTIIKNNKMENTLERRKREQVTERINDLTQKLNTTIEQKEYHNKNDVNRFMAQINNTPPGECIKELDRKLLLAQSLLNSYNLDIALLKKQIDFLFERIVDNEFEF